MALNSVSVKLMSIYRPFRKQKFGENDVRGTTCEKEEKEKVLCLKGSVHAISLATARPRDVLGPFHWHLSSPHLHLNRKQQRSMGASGALSAEGDYSKQPGLSDDEQED